MDCVTPAEGVVEEVDDRVLELETTAETLDENKLVTVVETWLLAVTDAVEEIDFVTAEEIVIVEDADDVNDVELETTDDTVAETVPLTIAVCVIAAVPVDDIVTLNVTLLDCVVNAVFDIEDVDAGVFVALNGIYPELKRGLLSNPVIFAIRKQFAVVKKLVNEYPVQRAVDDIQSVPQEQSSTDIVV